MFISSSWSRANEFSNEDLWRKGLNCYEACQYTGGIKGVKKSSLSRHRMKENYLKTEEIASAYGA